MRIIVEGPDGGGKTSFIDRLLVRYPVLVKAPRACTSEDGPIDELAQYVENDSVERRIGYWVYDRHPLVSELIYSPGMSRAMPEKFLDANWLRGQLLSFRNRANLVIYCLPPFPDVAKNVALNHGGTDHQNGVMQNLVGIYQLYYLAFVNDNPRAVKWDYTTMNFDSFCRDHFDYALQGL